jgi:hypothetical protein
LQGGLTDLSEAEIEMEVAELLCRSAFHARHPADDQQLQRVVMAVSKLAKGERLEEGGYSGQ